MIIFIQVFFCCQNFKIIFVVMLKPGVLSILVVLWLEMQVLLFLTSFYQPFTFIQVFSALKVEVSLWIKKSLDLVPDLFSTSFFIRIVLRSNFFFIMLYCNLLYYSWQVICAKFTLFWTTSISEIFRFQWSSIRQRLFHSIIIPFTIQSIQYCLQ